LNRFRDRPFVVLGLIGVFVAALTLAGCGRKGPLDPPPAASVAGEPGTAAASAERVKVEKDALKQKHFVLDPLLN